MKKTLFLFIALAGLFSSCSNDDITIVHDRTITFKVNPSTVVQNLYEMNAGDLTALTSGSKLHVSLFIYDENGNLIKEASEQYSAYTHMMTTDLNLPSGRYTALATSHVTSSVDFWTFSGKEKLSTFKITDNGYIGGKSKILGLTVMTFSVGNESKTLSINIENAGAVALVFFSQWNKYSNISTYALMGKQTCDYVSFDNQGTKDYSIKSVSSYNYYRYKTDYNPAYTGNYGYFFTFPIKNASFQFHAWTTDNTKYTMGPELIDDVLQGETYVFMYDFDTNSAVWYDMTPSNAPSNLKKIVDDESLIYNDNERIVYDYEGQSLFIQ